MINNKISYEVLLGRKPNYEHLKVFGCLTYVVKNKRERKFDERGKAYVFVGYLMWQKGYKIYVVSEDAHVSKDVVFFEDMFPFKEGGLEKHNKDKQGSQVMAWDNEVVIMK